MGGKALNDRLLLLRPRILIAESMYWYNGKRHDISQILDTSIRQLQQGAAARTEAVIVGPTENLESKW